MVKINFNYRKRKTNRKTRKLYKQIDWLHKLVNSNSITREGMLEFLILNPIPEEAFTVDLYSKR